LLLLLLLLWTSSDLLVAHWSSESREMCVSLPCGNFVAPARKILSMLEQGTYKRISPHIYMFSGEITSFVQAIIQENFQQLWR
jgi:hypothetical protein